MGLRFPAIVAAFAAAVTCASAASADCAIHGSPAHFGRARIKPEGAPAFELTITRAPMTAYLRRFFPTTFEVEEPLLFRAEALEPVVYSLSRTTEAADGIVRLGTDVVVRAARAARDDVAVDAELTYGVMIRDVRVPCGALSMDPPSPASSSRAPRSGETWTTSGRVVTFHAGLGVGATVRLEVNRSGVIEIDELDDSVDPTWASVEARFDGTTLRGFVARSALSKKVDPSNMSGSGFSRSGGCGFGTPRGAFVGPAKIAVNTPVYERANGKPWALVQRNDGLRVLHLRGDAWVEIVDIEGVSRTLFCTRTEHAFVRRSAVTFPEGVTR